MPFDLSILRLETMKVEDLRYQQSLDYLYSFVDYSLTKSYGNLPEVFDLIRMQELLSSLGNPHLLCPVIHVAGTKGKGSTAALIASVLQAAGYQTGIYTSPHLQDYNERIQVNGCPISHMEISELIEVIKPTVEKINKLTTFEITTALGFLHFARKKVDVAVVEVGLGGRLDATNLVDPLVSVITSISYDHTNVLGNTLSQIAIEKAGIIKPGRPVVSSPQKFEVNQVIENVVAKNCSPLTLVGRDYFYSQESRSFGSQTFRVWTSHEQDRMNHFIEGDTKQSWQPVQLTMPLLGYHQLENGTTAYAALQVAKLQGMNISTEDIQKGFKDVFWPARFEILSQNPILIIDSAHNRDAALKLRIALDEYLPGKRVIMVIGTSEDKDIEGIFAELAPKVLKAIATKSIHPRAINEDRLVDIAHRFGISAQAITPVEAALAKALEGSANGIPIVVTGSIFLAAGVREIWQGLGHSLRNFGVENQ